MRSLQQRIVERLEKYDGDIVFSEDAWQREEGGGGFTCTCKEGRVLEKGGVAYSAVHGPVSDAMKKQLQLEGESFYATGVSIVLHPYSPHTPIIHMNVRYFELNDGTCWFGGGIDLTPHYIDPASATLFHARLKKICDQFHPDFYPRFKNWADDYFFIPHRNETRGIGGVFYDHLIPDDCGISKEQLLEFAMALGDGFVDIYAEQANIGMTKRILPEQSDWQRHRRGRYVEFNLVHDRGTKFGLFSGGRTESILMSLPPQANWTYCHSIKPNSEEARTQQLLKKGIDWLALQS